MKVRFASLVLGPLLAQNAAFIVEGGGASAL